MDKRTGFWNLLIDIIFPREIHEVISDQLTVEDLETLIGRSASIYFSDCIAPLPYSHRYVKSAIHAMKYYGHKKIPHVLAQAIAPTVGEELSELRLFGTFTDVVLVPIPLHEIRHKERGFNQSQRLCEALFDVFSDSTMQIDTQTLVRKKQTLPQAQHTSKDARIKNMQGAFDVQDRFRISGKDVLLVDDVVTTGTTLREAKNTLLEHGARQVLCIAVAH